VIQLELRDPRALVRLGVRPQRDAIRGAGHALDVACQAPTVND
jgi:hypothetical protein